MPTIPTVSAFDDGTRTPVELPELGQRVGRYTILAPLGVGGMGAVFLASDPELVRRVALKVVASDRIGDQLLLDEARALAQLQHPNVVAVHEVGRWKGQVYVVMEHVAGAPLDRWLDEHTDWRERLAMFRQAAAGLAAAHRAGIVHRDVKPSNIMIGEDGRARLIDFGLACGTMSPSSNDRAGGTPRYMSPEQLDGGAVDARGDQFSFCVALYEALFGDYPFDSVVPGDRGAVTPPPTSVVPSEVRRAVLRGLATASDKRHASMDALIRALDPPRRVRRRALIGAITMCAALVVAAGAIAYSRRDPVTPRGAWDAILAASALPPEQHEPLPDDPLQVTVHRLHNGLTVYVSPNHDVPRIRAIWRFRVGSGEAPGVSLLAVLMARQGTDRIGTIDYASEKPLLERIRTLYAQRATADATTRAAIDRDIDAATTAAAAFEVPNEHSRVLFDLGARNDDAGLSRDRAKFEMDFPSNRFKVWAELEADRWAHPAFRMFRAEVARMASPDILGKIPFDAVVDRVLPVLFAGQRVGFDVNAQREAMAREPYGEVEKFFATWFVPNNADLILAGDIDPVEAIAELDKAFAAWEPRELPRREAARETPPAASATVAVSTTKGGRSVSYHWIVPAAVRDDPAFGVAQFLIMRLLGDARVDTASDFYLSAFVVSATPGPHQQAPDMVRAIDAAIDRVRRGEFSDAAFATALRAVTIKARLGAWDNASRAGHILADREGGSSARAWRDHVAREVAVARVSRADVVRIAHAAFDPPHVTAIAEPGDVEPDAIVFPKAPPASYATTRSKLSHELVEREVVPLQPKFVVEGTDFETRDTPAGHVVFKRDTRSALFRLSLQFDIGWGELPVICQALEARITVGTRTRWLDLGAVPHVDCLETAMSIEVTALDADLPLAIETLVATLGDITAAEWATEVDTTEAKTTALPGRSEWIGYWLEQRAMFGPGGRATFRRGAFRATPVREVARELAVLRRSARSVGYYGPRSFDDLVALLPARERGSGASRKHPGIPGGPPRVILVDASRLTSTAHAHVLFGAGFLDNDPRALLFEQYWNPDGHRLADEIRDATRWRARMVASATPRAPSYFAFQLDAAPADIVSVVDRLRAEVLDREVDPVRFERAKQEGSEALRADWIARSDVVTRVLRFRLRGAATDPRAERFARFTQLTRRDLDRFIGELRSEPRVIAIWGNLEGIDRGKLARLGQITELSVDELIDQLGT